MSFTDLGGNSDTTGAPVIGRIDNRGGDVFRGPFKSGLVLCRSAAVAPTDEEMARTGRPRAKEKRTIQLKTLVFDSEKEAFTEACAKAKSAPADTLRELAAAWVRYVEENPRASLHFRVTELE